MGKILIIIALALLLASPLAAQQSGFASDSGLDGYRRRSVDLTMEQLLSARETLIKRYILSSKLVVRVAVCGTEDVLNGDEHSYLTVYIHRDSMKAFFDDFANFAVETSPGGTLGVGGVPVSVEILDPVGKSIPPVQPKPQPDNRTDYPTRKV